MAAGSKVQLTFDLYVDFFLSALKSLYSESFCHSQLNIFYSFPLLYFIYVLSFVSGLRALLHYVVNLVLN